jgi:hypothetical protein
MFLMILCCFLPTNLLIVRERAQEQREIIQDQRARLRQERELEQDARRYLMQFQGLNSVR